MMANRLNISFDSDMLESISAELDLRAPNKEALRQLVFTLDGDYDPTVMQVLNLATGVGKTYLMAAFCGVSAPPRSWQRRDRHPRQDGAGQDRAEFHARHAPATSPARRCRPRW